MSVKTYNPKDDNKPILSCSDAAKAHIKGNIAKRGSGIGLRIDIKEAGCSGYQYIVDIVDNAKEHDHTVKLDANCMIFISAKALPVLAGTHLDYVREGLNHRFVFSNPNETGSCGCGESFTID